MQQMCDIYSKAERVLIWIGETNEETAHAIQYVDRLNFPGVDAQSVTSVVEKVILKNDW